MNKHLTMTERLVCAILSNLKYDVHDNYYKCFWNDMLMNISCILLKGRDPVDFICYVCDTNFDEPRTAEAFRNIR